ncbi:steroid 17-alpha-hydroxylase/17,20 lyase-like [Oppia nitens]|uniref:steroid 17-alpha-hydroxylase/17,20 lyase-like n=1 Tax=Oppia nitens TaxID=1686743 RepID=UPI0023DCA2EF|nr:steroid 17-alpha-hydroxylase/17,20 lyase-like [Oppia nitens]
MSKSDNFEKIIVNCVDKTIESMLVSEGPDKSIMPLDYIYLIYTFDDLIFKKIKYLLRDFNANSGNRIALWQGFPLIQWIDYRLVRKHYQLFAECRSLIADQLVDRYNHFVGDYSNDSNCFLSNNDDDDGNHEGIICDTLVREYSKGRYRRSKTNSIQTDHNLRTTTQLQANTDSLIQSSMFSLIVGGVNSSQLVFQWLLLLLAYYPVSQQRLRSEISRKIGDRLPRHTDRHRCHYVMAFIAETLRFRNPAAFGAPHNTLRETKIDKWTVPSGTVVNFFQSYVLLEDKHFPNGSDFLPDRFIDSDGHYLTNPSHPSFIPFGVGRRQCLGIKYAIAEMFLVLVRFLQSTQDYDIVLDSHNGIQPNPMVVVY